MSTVLTTYADLADRFGAVVDTLPADAWDAPSACEGWSGRDVVAHVIGSQRDFFARHGLDAGPVGASDLTSDPVGTWHAHDAVVRSLLADEHVAAREYDGLLGRTTIGATMTSFYGFDLVVHRWDLARAAARDEALTPAELDLVEGSLPGFGDHLYDDGVCKPPVPVSDDADRQVRLLALLGRPTPVTAGR
ncbi:hypothetical protein N865_06290 [Intrasporangium oryzae NRRL B-24470]|uniref:Mycothiol-dependent maleylpyruvate isomerase metal-binding domain-containing protein n=1 Tax=Intrasporangium oryzae NRRL B-24470 TaxID=1386089 RepID=W9GAX0_9MICO|nr:TIGR03086 family metal-binding protein [Intrasporangium oryzae]EWT02377.1 hypothetical protein N865_06290 [Intrasporangium oryzae NRRL B-24470]